MNKYQRVVVIVAAANIALMLLFPPFLDNPLRRGVLPNFEGFYPLLTAYGVKRIHNELLTLQIMFVVINALIAWLVLDRRTAKGELPEFRYTRAIALFLFGNLALIFAFPPFETYASLYKFDTPGFDSFYFVLGDKRQRHFYIPILYLEVNLVVINALVVWLLFNTLRRAEVFARDRILELAEALPATQLAEVSKTLAYKAVHPAAAPESPEPHLGAGRDRRKYQDPRFRGPERRKGGDRRLKPRTA
ncbi:MAG: hypothetical protein AMXMBFR31_19940 [Candidatus Desulfobacillus denitrificans]|jgi:hypothetical protein|uniref:Uncharacterized protein n=1 Tax=Candidatus Desulfobacillus denitrificans TaxID=2608985 RepID=A0A809QXN1_9PROT|nr:hypothetical protein [Rhodocyclaceae bacterium]OQY73055.1 MAG: hypothetical protein B6D47_04130 [Rhodocyclaceae bacterium UTPRO2]BBO20169.1 conserved hypothetical protein [Candidatus Desulfobacillus denitrificans]GIK46020.1 MAG: hypothetical protein BroJett012_19230 [Betaproteobacteria bacterium]GJQ55002.1 MAG: hypothetical protein HKUEN07_15710 [Rhodocyclaceae bacterium]